MPIDDEAGPNSAAGPDSPSEAPQGTPPAPDVPGAPEPPAQTAPWGPTAPVWTPPGSTTPGPAWSPPGSTPGSPTPGPAWSPPTAPIWPPPAMTVPDMPWAPPGATPTTPPTPAAPAAAAPAPGWYPDPWLPGRRRFWGGTTWTAHSFPEEARPAGERPTALAPRATAAPLPTAGVAGGGPPPPEWRPPETAPPPPPADWGAPLPPAEPKPGWWPPRGRTLVAILLVVAFIVGLGGGLVLLHRSPSPSAVQATPGSGTIPQPSPSPTDPNASLLPALVLQQTDVQATETVETIPGGDRVAGEATLDLCNGTYPSEALRTARLQVAGLDVVGDALLSTEAVLYQSPTDTAQAFSELSATAANCPNSPVVSPVGEPTVTTVFGPAPDAGWPQVTGVQRLAFQFTETDDTGNVSQSVAVYLRRGRALLGVYFPSPTGPQAPVDGQTTIPGIVNIFAQRMAALPAGAIGA